MGGAPLPAARFKSPPTAADKHRSMKNPSAWQTAPEQDPSTPHRPLDLLLCSLVFLALCARSFFLQYRVAHQMSFVDDSYYYIVLAQNLVHKGKSTFDGSFLTNGYHPLWTLLLALQYKLFGASLVLTRCVEFLLGLGTLLTTLLVVRLPNTLLNLFFTFGIFALLSRIAFNGMETALFAFCLGLFTWLSARRAARPASGLLDGLLAAAAIGSRIDAAVFIVPQLYFAASSRTRRIVAFSALLVCGLFYAALNHHLFGVDLPISGEIKSLGGLQLNHMFLRSLSQPSQPAILLFYLTFALWLLSPYALARTTNRALRHLLFAFLLGFPIFALRLIFLSSWRIWVWYDYPVLIGYIGCAPVLLLSLQRQAQRLFTYTQLVAVTATLGVLAAGLSVHSLLKQPSKPPLGYYAINHLAIDHFAAILHAEPVAMGDRAGNFAYQYSGSVSQLEGLMNDREYFQLLRSKGDVNALLCRRNVQFVLSYEPDLGNYQTHQVQTIRSELSQYAAPRIQLTHADEIGRVSDLSQFNAASFGDPNVYLYLWKLPCSPQPDQVGSRRIP